MLLDTADVDDAVNLSARRGEAPHRRATGLCVSQVNDGRGVEAHTECEASCQGLVRAVCDEAGRGRVMRADTCRVRAGFHKIRRQLRQVDTAPLRMGRVIRR